MGRIEEALRKAKAVRGGDAGRPRIGGSTKQRNTGRPADADSREANIPPILASHVVRADNEQLREQRVIAASDHDERVEPYRQLRTRVLKTMRDNQWTTLAITSPNEGAGKSLTASNLAISFSRAPNTDVLLVDLDLKSPTIHKKMNLNPTKGVVDFLTSKASLEEILFDPGLNNLMVLPGRSAGKYSSELLASTQMRDLMRDLCQQDGERITIFDLPPLLRNDDALLFAPYADATLLVIEDGVTTQEQLQNAMQLLDKANFIGTILNKART